MYVRPSFFVKVYIVYSIRLSTPVGVDKLYNILIRMRESESYRKAHDKGYI